MPRVLLTGGTGFVGANLARRLLADGHQVDLLVRPGYAAWRLAGLRSDVRLHEVDLTDAEGVGRTVGEVAPAWIFHLAAHGAYSWQTDPRRIVETNVLGAINLIEAACRVGFEALVQAGSSSEYGLKDSPPAEDAWLEPNSPYAVAKAAATHYGRDVSLRRDVAITTLRLYSVYGPWEDPGRLLPTLIVNGLAGRWPPLVSPETARDFVYVDDVCDAFVRAATATGARGAVYNVGTGHQTRLRDLVALAAAELAITAAPDWGSMPGRSWDTTCWVADPRRITAELGWRPQWPLAEGFRALVRWLRDDPAAAAYRG